jgi:hypothetical protein
LEGRGEEELRAVFRVGWREKSADSKNTGYFFSMNLYKLVKVKNKKAVRDPVDATDFYCN